MRRLSPEEAALWARVMAQVRPLSASRLAEPAVATPPLPRPAVPSNANPPAAPTPPSRPRAPRTAGLARRSPQPPANTLDGTWDRRFARGAVAPDRTIDLHGHTLQSAHDLLDAALSAALRSGERVILLVTGKPPHPASERPHARGVIRAAIGDWLAGSRHAAGIVAVRAAHARHGGAGALYIILKRPQNSRKS